jgi:hypothetical protein
MAAGIISTNLPTMLPALNVFLRTLSIESKDGTSRTGGSSNPFRSTRDRSTASQRNIDGEVRPPTGKRASGTLFYRLPDESNSKRSATGEGKLSSDAKGYQYTVESLSARDEESGCEIPLHGVLVEKDTVMESSNARSSRQ